MDCPRCSGVEMEELSLDDGTIVHRCTECSSIWIDSGDLTRALLHHNLPGLDGLGGRENLGEAAGTCPEDLTDLVVIESTDNGGHAYAMCEVCGGVWLEHGLDDAPFEGETGEAIIEQVVAFFRAFAPKNRARV
jgi:Zn-finger nucleic acid-binding protein